MGDPARDDLFEDRRDVGRRLGEELRRYRAERPVVLGMARGGVPVADEVARSLGASLDVLVVRKVGAPGNPEYGLGAVTEGGVRLLDVARIREAGYTLAEMEPVIAKEQREVERRRHAFRGNRPRLDLRDRTVILVDDGVATGATLRAAIQAVRQQSPRRVIVALGVSPPEAYHDLQALADDVVVLRIPRHFFAVGQWYRHFEPVEDEEVVRILTRAAAEAPSVRA
jgi:putative phosphoribosyl transferase